MKMFWRVVRKFLGCLGMGVLAPMLLFVVAVFVMDIPGGLKFRRCRAHADLRTLMAAETNEIRRVIPFQQDGSNFTAVAIGYCRVMASGPAMLIYDGEGRICDWSKDVGDIPFRKSHRWLGDWNFARLYYRQQKGSNR